MSRKKLLIIVVGLFLGVALGTVTGELIFWEWMGFMSKEAAGWMGIYTIWAIAFEMAGVGRKA